MHILIIVFALILSSVSPALSEVKVVDGDTLSLNGVTYRLDGVDAPEAGQKCQTVMGKSWPCGDMATAQMADLVLNAKVHCEGYSEDGYGRTIGTCFADGVDIGKLLVRNGFAWAFVKYSDRYVEEEAQARKGKIGIWQGEAQTPWDYRADKWAVAEQEAPNGCPIKGNISKNGRIYHAPWSPWYTKTKVSVSKGERWFCSEAEALAAGWRAPLWH